MRSSESTMVASSEKPWPSPSYTWWSTVAPAARIESTSSCACAGGTTLSSAPCSTSTGTPMSCARDAGERSR